MSIVQAISAMGVSDWVGLAFIVALVVVGIVLIVKDRNIEIKGVKLHKMSAANSASTSAQDAVSAGAFNVDEARIELQRNRTYARGLLYKMQDMLYARGCERMPSLSAKDKVVFKMILQIVRMIVSDEMTGDFIRNGIDHMSDAEFDEYVRQKSEHYYAVVKEQVDTYNANLPEFDLMLIFEGVSAASFKNILYEIYSYGR